MPGLEYNVKALRERGLSADEALAFINLLNKITPTKEDTKGFYTEMDEGIPFEGGMGFTEALTGIKISMQ
jgi:hypothetical protein